MKILAITFAFAPIPAPASYRTLKWFLGLHARGHEVHVLSADPTSRGGRLDPSLSELVPADVKNTLASWPGHGLHYRILRRLRPLTDSLFEPVGREWLTTAARAASAIPADSYELIFSCSQPPVDHLVGEALKDATGKPWVAYFSDPWSDSPFDARPVRSRQRYNQELETRICDKADALVYSSPETVELVMRKFPASFREKTFVLPHCYVPEWYERQTSSLRPPTGGRKRILHTGSLYGPRSLQPVVSALKEIADERGSELDLELTAIGGLDDAAREYAAANGLEHVIRSHGAVSYLDSLATMRSADCLLAVDAPLGKVDQSVYLPSKLIDYLGSLRPVLGVTPSKGATARVLRECGGAVSDVSDADAIKANLRALLDDGGKFRPDPERVRRYHYERIAKELEAILESVA